MEVLISSKDRTVLRSFVDLFRCGNQYRCTFCLMHSFAFPVSLEGTIYMSCILRHLMYWSNLVRVFFDVHYLAKVLWTSQTKNCLLSRPKLRLRPRSLDFLVLNFFSSHFLLLAFYSDRCGKKTFTFIRLLVIGVPSIPLCQTSCLLRTVHLE